MLTVISLRLAGEKKTQGDYTSLIERVRFSLNKYKEKCGGGKKEDRSTCGTRLPWEQGIE